MNFELTDLLRAGIDHATAGERLGPGLRARARRRVQRRRLTIWTTAATGSAAVVAGAVFLAVVAGGQATSFTPPGGRTGVRLDAAVVLEGAARAALSGPTPQDNQFLYTDVRSVNPNRSRAWNSRQQTWESADGRQPGAIRNTTCFPGLPAHDNLPTCLIKIPVGRGGPLNVTYAWARSLPTDPAALLRYLEHHNNCSGIFNIGLHRTPYSDAFSEIITILESLYVLPPSPGAALFRAAALIPGVMVLRSVTDAAGGGRGIAVAMTGLDGMATPPVRFELIFAPRTYRFIGLQIIALRPGPGQVPGEVIHAEWVVSSQVVDTAPVNYTKISSTPMVEGGVPNCISLPQRPR
jgi:hypothetical protein